MNEGIPTSEANRATPIEKKSEAELHYRELKAYFDSLVKYTLTALGIIIAGAAIFFFKNLSEVKSEAKAAIDAERNIASAQLDSIRRQASELAIQEAKRRVDEAFKANNVVEMVETAARRQLGSVNERQVARQVDQYMNSVQEDITSLGTIGDLAMKMRFGFRTGLEELEKIDTGSSNEKLKQRARTYLKSITADYETRIKQLWGETKLKSPVEARKFASVPDSVTRPILIGKLAKMVRDEDDLSRVASAFFFLRENTGVQFAMFDNKSVRRWCADHPKEWIE